MSKREGWLFRFTAKQIKEAAEKQEGYHRERAKWWNGEYDKAVAKAKKKGFIVKEFQITGGVRPELQIDQALAGRVTEAHNKRASHADQANSYERWAEIMRSQPGSAAFELDASDVLYFGLGK